MVMIATFTAAEIAAAEAAAVAAAEIAAAEAAAAAAAQAAAAEAAAASAASTATTAGTTAAADAGITGATNAGITQAGAMTPQQAAYMDASTAGINSVPGVQPLPAAAPTAPANGIPQNLQMNTGFGQTPVEPININPQASGYGNVIDKGGMNAPQPSAFEAGFDRFSRFAEANPIKTSYLGYTALNSMGAFDPKEPDAPPGYNGSLSKYKMSDSFQGRTADPEDYRYTPQYASGGIMFAGGGPVEQMSNANAIGANTGYPMADINKAVYSTPYQTPMSQNVVQGTADIGVNPMTGEQNFAAGGIAHFARGNLASSLEHYTDMMDGKSSRRAMPEKGDPGIYRDTDPDTMYLDPLSAAQVRMAKVNKRANMQLPAQKRPTPMGQLNLRPQGIKAEAGGSSLDPEHAAQGGIMQAGGHLGGYAAGGNARLLKGPGDGMSDNIPATIAGKQPARLADGEFVVPADVVSHLGNGSTEAGAKKLHQMMTQVRKARTGNPKQGKQINPNKFTPK